MTTQQLARSRVSAVLGGAAIVAMIGLTAAHGGDQQAGIAQGSMSPAKIAVNAEGDVFSPPVTAPQQTFDPQD